MAGRPRYCAAILSCAAGVGCATLRFMNATTAPGAVEIRRLVPADWAALREVRLAGLTEAPYAFASTLDREAGFDELTWRERLSSTAHLGAERSGPAAGLVGLVAGFPEPLAWSGGGAAGAERGPAGRLVWHLASMWVSPQVRGQGVADGLVAAICALARTQGATQMALWVTDVNTRARAFYRRAGFRETGQRSELGSPAGES
jgi:ribosomal protein S18 acetylase RimI-like enzyme